MQTITINTSQNIGIDYEVAGLGERILARLIDFTILIALFFCSLLLISLLGTPDVFGITFLIISAVIFGFYDLICEVFFNGQSIGKRAMKIRVISLNGGRPTIGQYLIRWVCRIIDFGFLQLVALISALVTQKVQRVGDVLAGTTLIRTKPRTQMHDLVYHPSADDYMPVFNEVMQLNDKDISLINEVINNYYKTANTTVVFNLAQRLKAHLNVIQPPEMSDLSFLQTLIKDYTHLAALSGLQLNS